LDIDRTITDSQLEAAAYYDGFVDLFARAKGILDLLGESGRATTLAKICEVATNIVGISNIFLPGYDEGSIGLCIPKTAMPDAAKKIDLSTIGTQAFLMISCAEIGGITFAYCVQGKMIIADEGDHLAWRSVSVSPKDIVHLPKFPDGFQSFVDRMKGDMPPEIATAVIGPHDV
jgi:hypothetical protein